MCGVSGFWGPSDRALLDAMMAAQVHRGPDDFGSLVTEHASLGFRRLSIIDLAGGHQPMSTDDGLVHISYNGEVYNFRELRAELETLGHQFHTTCDTEVVLQAYAEWDVRCFERFNGMWGLALLDQRGPAPRVVLARDHFGIKPMYYAEHGDRVLFASEIKAILQDRSFPRRVDEQQMYEYLAFGLFDHTEKTFFDGVRAVPAAAYAIVDGDGILVDRYWEPVLSEDGSGDPAEFRAVFERSVERRLVADVPVGICLSGGLDSSSICTVMARQLEEHVPDAVSLGDRLQTFSAVFPGDPIDETRYIDSVLDVTGAATSRCEPTAKDFVREMEPWVWHIEEPMVSSAPFAMWMVMRLAREKVTVTLDGQGGDELLGGYDHYPYVYLRELLKKRRYRTFAQEAWRTRDVVGPLVRRRLGQRRHPVNVRELLTPAFARACRPPVDDRVKDDVKLRLLQDFTTYSLPPLLRYEDRASMAHSLEARLPFLDQELVEHILALPAHAIIEHGWNRRVLREGLKDTLPPIVYRRRKKIGFTTPEFRWYRRERAVLNGLLNSPSFAARPYWDAPAVADAFRRACDGDVEESMFFWRAINAEVWMRIFFDDDATALDDESYRAGFVARGDRSVAREQPEADAVLRVARSQSREPRLPADRRRDLRSAPVEVARDHAGRRRRRRDPRGDRERRRPRRRRRRRRAREREGALHQPGQCAPGGRHPYVASGGGAVALRAPDARGCGPRTPGHHAARDRRGRARPHPARSGRDRGHEAVRGTRRLLPRRRRAGERDRRPVEREPAALRRVGVPGAERLRGRGTAHRERDRSAHGSQGRRGHHRRQRHRRRGLRHHAGHRRRHGARAGRRQPARAVGGTDAVRVGPSAWLT